MGNFDRVWVGSFGVIEYLKGRLMCLFLVGNRFGRELIGPHSQGHRNKS
jgi:hypothetical protein